jgi:hypothetical protein
MMILDHRLKENQLFSVDRDITQCRLSHCQRKKTFYEEIYTCDQDIQPSIFAVWDYHRKVTNQVE